VVEACISDRVFPKYGDRQGSWALKSSKCTIEEIELEYQHEVYITQVDIFETYNCGHVQAYTHSMAQTGKKYGQRL